MSDGFDKEAEREKLREKLADDAQKREHTQRMSELLLKGATMTNRHCDDCGDPIFRHDGREFCPSCGNEADGAAGAEAPSPADARTDAPPADGTGAADRADGTGAANPAAEAGAADRAAQNGAPDASAASSADAGEAAGSETGARAGGTAPTEPAPSAAPDSARTGDASRAGAPPRAAPRREDAADGDRTVARASLTRTLTRFARAAEEAEDPRRAREYLTAAREAAEALAALDR